MKPIKAQISGSTRLELSQPIDAERSHYIAISIAVEVEEEEVWRAMSSNHFLEAYDDRDTICIGISSVTDYEWGNVVLLEYS